MVSAQTPQRVLDFLAQPRSRGVSPYLAAGPFEAALGRNDGLIAQAAGKRLTHDLFRTPEAVDRRGIDQRNTLLDRRPNGADRFFDVAAAPHPATDCPSAQTNARGNDPGRPDLNGFHAFL